MQAYKEIFENEAQLQELKKNLVRFGVEELLRRKVNDDAIVQSDDALIDFLIDDAKAFLDKTFAVRRAEIEKEYDEKSK